MLVHCWPTVCDAGSTLYRHWVNVFSGGIETYRALMIICIYEPTVTAIVLYCIVLYCIVLHCIALHCIALHCIVLYCIVLYCIVLYCIVLYCIVLYCIVLYWIGLDWIGLDWIGLDWIGLDWIGLDWIGLRVGEYCFASLFCTFCNIATKISRDSPLLLSNYFRESIWYTVPYAARHNSKCLKNFKHCICTTWLVSIKSIGKI